MRLNEDKHLASKMLKAEVSVKLELEAHVPDMMTLVRILPSVAVVGQTDKVERSTAEGTVADIYVKFLPVPGSVYFNLVKLCKAIKALPGVKIVKVEKLGGRKVVYKGQPIVI
jgi:hypothetical protein